MMKSKGDTPAATFDSDDILVQSYCFLIPHLQEVGADCRADKEQGGKNIERRNK